MGGVTAPGVVGQTHPLRAALQVEPWLTQEDAPLVGCLEMKPVGTKALHRPVLWSQQSLTAGIGWRHKERRGSWWREVLASFTTEQLMS